MSNAAVTFQHFSLAYIFFPVSAIIRLFFLFAAGAFSPRLQQESIVSRRGQASRGGDKCLEPGSIAVNFELQSRIAARLCEENLWILQNSPQFSEFL